MRGEKTSPRRASGVRRVTQTGAFSRVPSSFPSMSTIFISYRRTDSKHTTSRIHDRLRLEFGKGHVFKDVDSIPLGTDFREVLRDKLGRCRVALAVIGPTWATIADADGKPRLMNPADFVRLELESLLARKIPVIP